MKARYVKNLDWTGDARLYRLENGSYIVVSALVVKGSGPETYIFTADDRGDVSSFAELDGSFQGGLDHMKALRRAGHEVEE